MGPRFFKRGNKIVDFQIVESLISFNGAALFQARKYETIDITSEVIRALQWGRAFSSAEMRPLSRIMTRIASASMGPRFFKRGNKKQRRRTD